MTLATQLFQTKYASLLRSRLLRMSVVGGVFLLVSYVIPLQGANLDDIMVSPSLRHWLGTDAVGQDILQRIIIGMRYSLLLSVGTVTVTGIIGVYISVATVGYTLTRSITHMISHIFIALPPLIITLLLISRWGTHVAILAFAQCVAFMPTFIKISYQELHACLQSDYAQLSIHMGNLPHVVLYKHGLPVLLPKMRVQMLSLLSVAIGIESGLSYLGLGPPLPHTGLGYILSDSFSYWQSAPWYPASTLLCFFGIINAIIWTVNDPLSRD